MGKMRGCGGELGVGENNFISSIFLVRPELSPLFKLFVALPHPQVRGGRCAVCRFMFLSIFFPSFRSLPHDTHAHIFF